MYSASTTYYSFVVFVEHPCIIHKKIALPQGNKIILSYSPCFILAHNLSPSQVLMLNVLASLATTVKELSGRGRPHWEWYSTLRDKIKAWFSFRTKNKFVRLSTASKRHHPNLCLNNEIMHFRTGTVLCFMVTVPWIWRRRSLIVIVCFSDTAPAWSLHLITVLTFCLRLYNFRSRRRELSLREIFVWRRCRGRQQATRTDRKSVV